MRWQRGIPGVSDPVIRVVSCLRLGGKPTGAACQRGSCSFIFGGKWNVMVKSVLPGYILQPNHAGAKVALAPGFILIVGVEHL